MVQSCLRSNQALAALIQVSAASLVAAGGGGSNAAAITYTLKFSVETQQFPSAASGVDQIVNHFNSVTLNGNFTRLLQESSPNFAGVTGASTASASSFISHVVTVFSPSAAPSFVPGTFA